jgi:hypothetical protein
MALVAGVAIVIKVAAKYRLLHFRLLPSATLQSLKQEKKSLT